MTFTLSGKVVKVGDRKAFSKSSMRPIIVEYDNGYETMPLQFEFWGKLCDASIEVGSEISVDFDVRGREWTPNDGGDTRYFVSLKAVKFDVLSQAGF